MKKDKNLGKEIGTFLQSKGVETPFQNANPDKQMISKLFKEIMLELGLEIRDDSLAGTPDRIAKMYVDEIFNGLDYANFPKCTTVQNKMQYDEMVTVDQINVSSTCEHHFVVIDGFAKVAYIPNKTVLGLSKINRIVEFFSKRPQIQERLTEQVYYALSYILETEDIAVMIKAVHHCVKSRGVCDVNSTTRTTKIGGVFKTSDSARMEFLKS